MMVNISASLTYRPSLLEMPLVYFCIHHFGPLCY